MFLLYYSAALAASEVNKLYYLDAKKVEGIEYQITLTW